MNIGILLWNTCNARCDHCAVSSGPREKPQMTDEQIFAVIDSAFVDSCSPSIGMSGGEAFLFFERLCRIVEYAAAKGASVSVNTNGFWGNREERARDYVATMKRIGLTKLVVSTDGFHAPYVREQAVVNVIRACIDHGLEVDLQYVYSTGSPRLHQFAERWRDDLVNISMREIPVHPVGRAAAMVDPAAVPGRKGLPTGRCPSAIPSISADGRVIPCCNTAGHLSSLELGRVAGGDLPDIYARFHDSDLFYALWEEGPHVFHDAAVAAGLDEPPSGYVDQCHLCYHIFNHPEAAASAKRRAAELARAKREELFARQYSEALGVAGAVPDAAHSLAPLRSG